MDTKIRDQAFVPDRSSDDDDVSSSQVRAADLICFPPDVPESALQGLRVIRDLDGNGFLQIGDETTVTRLDSSHARALVLRHAVKAGNPLRPHELREVMECLIAYTPLSPHEFPVWNRVALIDGGIEIDMCDETHRRIRVTPGRVEIVPHSPVYFFRPTTARPFVVPDEDGDFSLLDPYLNMKKNVRILLKGWIGYVLAHAKVSSASIPLLVLNGDQGSGKSFTCRLVQTLIDPSTVGLRTFPNSPRDLAIAAQQSHLLMFDNVRTIRPAMSDALCIAATGGSLATRRLYTDSEMVAHQLHVAVILNGITEFVDQQDLAQRCVPIALEPMQEGAIRSESVLLRQFQADLARIFAGLLRHIASVMEQLPLVEPDKPERLIDFSHWLAAMERVDGVPDGVYQAEYSAALDEGMRNSLLEHPVAAAVFDLIDKNPAGWSGTSSDLLKILNRLVEHEAGYPPDWPKSSIALAKQLRSLEAGLRRQGVKVRWHRSKTRMVTITRTEEVSRD